MSQREDYLAILRKYPTAQLLIDDQFYDDPLLKYHINFVIDNNERVEKRFHELNKKVWKEC